MFYRKKQVVIEAHKLTEENATELSKWCGGFISYPEQNNFDVTIMIDTLEGTMSARLGSYIIKGVKGEFYPCKPDIFEETYEQCEVA